MLGSPKTYQMHSARVSSGRYFLVLDNVKGNPIVLSRNCYAEILQGRAIERLLIITSVVPNSIPRHKLVLERSIMFLKKILDLVLGDGAVWLQRYLIE